MKTNYNEIAINFLIKHNTILEVKPLAYGKYFDSDTEPRMSYTCTLKRNNRSISFSFGDSVACSYETLCNKKWNYQTHKTVAIQEELQKAVKLKLPKILKGTITDFKKPNAYDVLSCIEKSDPGTFENFCANMGLDTDSRSAEKTYHAVKSQFTDLCTLFSDEELMEMQEIS